MQAAAYDVGTTLILVRHGESESNVAGRIGGQEDSRLTRRGRKQARDVAEFLARREKTDVVIASDLTRAAQTAAIIAEHLGVALETSDGLRECDVGELDGLTLEEAFARFPQAFAALINADRTYTGHGGESLAEFQQRVETTIADIATRHGGRRIVVVTHAGVIHQLLTSVLMVPGNWLSVNSFFSIANGSPTKLQVAEVAGHRKLWRLAYVGAPV